MITFLILIGPIPLLILYVGIRVRLKGQKHPPTQTQIPVPHEKPYEPEAPQQPNAFLRRFPLATQLYLGQQWTLARFGFIASLWILTVPIWGLLPLAHNVPAEDRGIGLSFVTGTGLWGAGIPAFLAFFAAVIAGSGIVSSAAAFTRTRPIPLRVIFWGRILPALAALLLATTVSMGIAFSALRMTYGPAWASVLTPTTTNGAQHGPIHPDDDETTEQAMPHFQWLAQNPAPRVLASSVTTMTLFFSAFVLLFCQPIGANRKFSSGAMKWIVPIAASSGLLAFNLLKGSSSTGSARRISQMFFYGLPFHASPPWRFLPVPIVLSMVLLFLNERIYLRRDN